MGGVRVLVTGHKGYIGTVLVPMFLDAGHDVVGLDSDLFRACTFREGIRKVPEIQLDLRDVERRHLEGFAAVIHLAWIGFVGVQPVAMLPIREGIELSSLWFATAISLVAAVIIFRTV